jgi:2-C-methyl-D-erythritol 4-phosphate cytidylyltransferase
MNIAILLAGSNSARFLNSSKNLPKAFYEECRNVIIKSCLEVFVSTSSFDKIIFVSNWDYVNKTADFVKKLGYDNVHVISGGITRQASVFAALDYLDSLEYISNPKIIIHDVARVLVSKKLILSCLQALDEHEIIATISTSNDHIIQLDEDEHIKGCIAKEEAYLLQTPQGFYLDSLRSAHHFALNLNLSISNDALLVNKLLNKEIYFIKTSPSLLKFTTEEDLMLFEKLIKERRTHED